ncbi:MAG TPA: phosphonate metabolism protein PhnP, partial [Pantoea sp.]|nr:phosphonate metabolism protein PhnP [Pantoea sp.]
WLCDTCGLPPDTDDFLSGQRIDELVIDCNDPPATTARNHNDLTRALAIIDRLAPRRAWLNHLSHHMDNWLSNNRLPEFVRVATDGFTLSLGAGDPVTV